MTNENMMLFLSVIVPFVSASLITFLFRHSLDDWISRFLLSFGVCVLLGVPLAWGSAWYEWRRLDISQRNAVQNAIKKGGLIVSGSLEVQDHPETIRFEYPKNVRGPYLTTLVLFPFKVPLAQWLYVPVACSILWGSFNAAAFTLMGRRKRHVTSTIVHD